MWKTLGARWTTAELHTFLAMKKKKAHLLGESNFGETSRISLAAVLTTGF